MGKRGKKARKGYFYEEQEQAVIDYLNTDDKEEKNRIYEEKLKIPFNKMVESIIRKYKLYVPDEDSGTTFNDALSFMLTKADKFKPGKTKAYSYYGTICKNHVIGRLQNYTKTLERNPSYDDAPEDISNSIRYSSSADNSAKIASETVKYMILKIEEMINNPEKFMLKDTEIKLGSALSNLLQNWDYVLSTDGSNKLNKNAILLFLRESTGLDTKGIRDNMKKFKKEFKDIREKLLTLT